MRREEIAELVDGLRDGPFGTAAEQISRLLVAGAISESGRAVPVRELLEIYKRRQMLGTGSVVGLAALVRVLERGDVDALRIVALSSDAGSGAIFVTQAGSAVGAIAKIAEQDPGRSGQ